MNFQISNGNNSKIFFKMDGMYLKLIINCW